MKFKKVIIMLFVIVLALALVACGKDPSIDDKPKDDPLTPVAISLKAKVAKVQINGTVKLTYAITPATAQGDKVTVKVSNDLATATVSGTNTINVTAGPNTGTIKVTVTTSNGIEANKTIKIQEEPVEVYPDLSGYTIKLAQAVQALGEYDVKLTQETADEYGFYAGADREYKIQAWDEIEDNYNCSMEVVEYPSDAPWGPSRWSYILTQAQNDAPEYDFYVIPDSVIPGLVAGNALLDLTDWYKEYGKNLMTEMSITAGTYKGKLYSINANEMSVYNILSYNLNLFDKIHAEYPDILEPAQMYLDGNWNYTTFEEYCIKVQNALTTMYGSEDKYYCLSGYGSYYWIGLVNAGGVKILDTTQLKVSITGATETLAAQTLQNIFVAGAMDPTFQVDQNVATWNAGHSLFNTGELWFVNASNRWNKTLWGTEEGATRYGFVPFPTSPSNTDPNATYCGTTAEACIVMPSGRDWAYKGFGDECTAENIYRAVLDYYNTAKNYYVNSEDYSKYAELTATASSKFSSEASVKAFIKVMLGTQDSDGNYKGGITEYGFYDPFVSNSNSVCGNVGGSGTFAGSINAFIKASDASQWIDAVGSFKDTIEKSLVESFG